MIKLETKRLIIRDHIVEDLLPLHSLISDEKAMFYIPDIKTINLEESKENLKVSMTEANFKNREKYFLAITLKETGEYVGEIGFTIISEYKEEKLAELGYFILPKFWSQGIVTEAAKEVISLAFNKVEITKLITGCVKENKGSEGVMKNLGMIKERELKSHIELQGKLYDRVEYRLFKREWELIDQMHFGKPTS
jgi:[ribosomal protein S5]-alanine N-acetyltransferase